MFEIRPVRALGRLAAAALLIPALAGAQSVRPAAFAGQFYPAGPAELAAWIDAAMTAAAPPSAPPGRVIGLIAPHAGYVYSGRTAAAAYGLVRGLPFETVVIVAPSHRVGFEGVSVWPDGGFETPIGLARVDAALAGEITRAARSKFRADVFAEEHAVEVQVPFVQRALPGAAIVPIVMGLPTRTTIRTLAAALAKTCLTKKVLVVASTDLSHFLPKAQAETTDAETAALIQGLRTDTPHPQGRSGGERHVRRRSRRGPSSRSPKKRAGPRSRSWPGPIRRDSAGPSSAISPPRSSREREPGRTRSPSLRTRDRSSCAWPARPWPSSSGGGPSSRTAPAGPSSWSPAALS